MSHRSGRSAALANDLQIPEPIAEVRLADNVRCSVHHRARSVRRTVVVKVWPRSASPAATAASVVTAEPRVVATAAAAAVLLGLWLLLLGWGRLFRHKYRCVCGEIVARSRRPQRGETRFGSPLPLATSALLIHRHLRSDSLLLITSCLLLEGICTGGITGKLAFRG